MVERKYQTYDEIKPLLDQQQWIQNRHALTGHAQGRWIFDFIQQTSPDAWVCEIGAFYGFMTNIMGLACLGSDRRVISIDHMIGSFCTPMDQRPQCIYLDYIDGLIQQGVWNKIVPFPMKSYGEKDIEIDANGRLAHKDIIREYLQAYEMLETMNAKFELIYIDGNHQEEYVYQEICRFSKFLPVGGKICFDGAVPGKYITVNEFWKKRYELRDKMNLDPKLVPELHGQARALLRFFLDNDQFKFLDVSFHNQGAFERIKEGNENDA